jgi:5-methylcytosine-specific restriction endonuclease McrA
MRNCTECSAEYLDNPFGRTKLTCSKDCKAKRDARLKKKPPINVLCKNCAHEFPSSHGMKYCSTECRTDHTNAKLRARPKSQEPKTLKCGWCSQDVIVPANYLSNRKYHDECKVRAKRARHRIKTVKRRARTVRPSRLSADQLVDAMGAFCGICKEPIDTALKRTSKMGLTVDHIIPLSKGGQDTLDNMQPAHWICNVKKGNRINA